MTTAASPSESPPSKRASRRRKRLLRIIVFGVCFIGVVWVSRRFWLPWLHDYLDVSQPPRPADFVVVLGGNTNSRVHTALALYRQGLVSGVIASGCSPHLEMQLALFEQGGVPSDAILVNDHAKNTWNEAKQVLALLQTEGATSALIITDRFHTRRVRATYAHLKGDLDIKLTFVASSDTLSSDNWWKNASGRSNVLKEYPKLVYYLLRHGIWPWEK
jgi:uncharacterized SAM-binding protein YcdF (DUF218 family)